MSCNLEVIPDEVVAGSISALNCSGATVSGTLVSGQIATNITVSVPYTGGDGGTHSGQTVLSTGVTGLTAKLDAGSFDTGSGILDYAVSGTPSASGNALFALNIGGKTCLLSVPVQALIGSITGLNCSGATTNGALYVNQAASNVSVAVPYTGGNGGGYTGQSVTSTGVTGLTATLSDSIFANGDGNLVYQITGTPLEVGAASFTLNLGGKTCSLSIPVQTPSGSIGSLNCGFSNIIGNLTATISAIGVRVFIPYTGGNGGDHNGQIVNSTGVVGLTATLDPGSFFNGTGNLEYSISGTPASAGMSYFLLNIGGKSCNLSLQVKEPIGSIGSLKCDFSTLTGSLTTGFAANGVSVRIPYTDGNGWGHDGQVVNSTGVVGLTATLEAGYFSSGSGDLVYYLSGTPTSSGTANFVLNIGGNKCNLLVSVNLEGTCFAKINGTLTKTFMCHNLGSVNTSADSFTPSWEIIGGYWQWGQTGQAAAGPTELGLSQANSDTISDWNTTNSPNGAWFDNFKTINDPCPTGFRVPTVAQWDSVRIENTSTNVGTWTFSPTNYSSGIKFGNNLFLPAAGFRDDDNGVLKIRGAFGGYWSSTEKGTMEAWFFSFGNNGSLPYYGYRTAGLSIRCIAE